MLTHFRSGDRHRVRTKQGENPFDSRDYESFVRINSFIENVKTRSYFGDHSDNRGAAHSYLFLRHDNRWKSRRNRTDRSTGLPSNWLQSVSYFWFGIFYFFNHEMIRVVGEQQHGFLCHLLLHSLTLTYESKIFSVGTHASAHCFYFEIRHSVACVYCFGRAKL